MTYTTFKKLNVKESKKIITAINDNIDLSAFDPEQSVVMEQNLIFYTDYKLLSLSDKTIIPEKTLYVLYKSPEDYSIIDYSNAPIYEMNKKSPLLLDTGSVTDYVRFFFLFVRGAQGRFIIAETLDDIKWQDEPPLNARKAIGKLLCPLTVMENKKDHFILKGTYIFLDGLIQSSIKVDQKGFISIQNEEVLIEDMPVIHEDFE